MGDTVEKFLEFDMGYAVQLSFSGEISMRNQKRIAQIKINGSLISQSLQMVATNL